ncbi:MULTISPECIES: NADH:flavin oxidoreductase/NADH oxidase [Hydrocarboniphaga]|uniref:NADH:flavin oxidoreductase/NADH oxidase n=1 Tax=Hydrocarboniphaga TaxID=243627 RepID=UPI002ABB1953|nr:NADH:flavin oxidoreductase/NADH oxidase [Hydrocarboniphaga sp.]MDZ4078937.1 NADH:flavin oxidoreductase/NADH oxidase [Hydrocarboniphaga sp.]
MTSASSSALFSSFALRGLTLRNRIVVSPMCQNSAVDGLPTPWHAMHLGSLAVSGAGLLILEATAVEADGRITIDDLGLYNDAQEAALSKLVADIRSYSDIPLGIQLAHAGRKASTKSPNDGRFRTLVLGEGEAWQTWAPSSIAFGEGWPTPRELDASGLARIRAAYVQAAKRAERIGFDLLELHAAHGYLLSQFLSPLTNQRKDGYGGSLENRMRFPLECLDAVREAWPAHKPIGVRINGSDFTDGGLTPDEATIYAQALREHGADYVTTSAGMVTPESRFPRVEPGYLLPLARPLRERGIVTMGVGMILTPRQAEQVIAEGQADLVALARALLDDPRWVWHAAEALGAEPSNSPTPSVIPHRYFYAHPRKWAGYRIVHPPAQSTAQA